MGHVDLVNILHQLCGLLLSNILAKCSAEIICDVVFAVREGSCAAESGHDGAGLAPYAGLDLLAVDGALALVQRVSHLNDSHLETAVSLHELIGREDSAGAGADYNNVISLIVCHLFLRYKCTII